MRAIYPLTLVLNGLIIFILSKINRIRFSFKNPKFYIAAIILSILSSANQKYIVAYLRPFLIFFSMILVNWIYSKKELKEIMLSSIILEFLIMFSEMFVMLLYIVLFAIPNTKEFLETYNMTVFSATSVFFMSCICMTNFPTKWYDYLLMKTEFLSKKMIAATFSFILIATTFLVYLTFFKVHFIIFLIISVVLFFLFSIIVLSTIKNKNDYLDIVKRYENALFSMKEYEDVIDSYKVRAHEEKNQFIIIRNMIGMEQGEQAKKYIENLVRAEYTEDEAVALRLTNIPSGGLRAIMYNKFLFMRQAEITCSFVISGEIKQTQFDDFDEKVSFDLTRIFSVYIDNAIDETYGKEDEGLVAVDVYLQEGYYVIEISNTIHHEIDFDKLDEMGYTTKSNGHGYGLPLVKQILDKNKFIKAERIISGNLYKQKIMIKL